MKELAAANDQYSERGLRCFFDESGSLVLEGRLDPVQGAVVMKALQAAGAALREADNASRESLPDLSDRPKDAYPARMADAIGMLCESFLAHGAHPLAAGDRHLVTVHIDEAVLRDEAEEGRSHVDDGPHLPPATVRRLCCDASLVAIVERADGTVLDVGRKTRAIPSALRRALAARDHGCRFPGCTNSRFVDAHHIEHWVNGGETKLGNLVTLCRRHHRFVHEYGFSVEQVGAELRFRRPDGRDIPSVPAPQQVDAEKGVQDLKAVHDRSGLAIHARTGIPKWCGERMDYGEAVGALQDRRKGDGKMLRSRLDPRRSAPGGTKPNSRNE